jgi:hypothetical protein
MGGTGQHTIRYWSRHITASTYFAANLTDLNYAGQSHTQNNFYADITAQGDLILDRVGIHGPLTVTVGGDLAISNNAAFTGNVTFYVRENATVTYGATTITNFPHTVTSTALTNPASGSGTITFIRDNSRVTNALGVNQAYEAWPRPTTGVRDLTVHFGRTMADDPNGAANLMSRYGINVTTGDSGIKQAIFYIDGSGTGPGQNVRIAQGSNSNFTNWVLGVNDRGFILIDTGLGANARTVNILLPRTIRVGSETRDFAWWFNGAVMTLGDGDVIFHVDPAGTYTQGSGPAKDVYVGPFNLAVGRDTSGTVTSGGDADNTSWHRCPRLISFIEASNGGGLGADGFGRMHSAQYNNNQADGATGFICTTSTADGLCACMNRVRRNPGYDGVPNHGNRMCFLLSLMDTSGNGAVRNNLDTAGRGARRIHGRGQERPLNLSVFLVHNGTGNAGVSLGTTGLFAGTVYAPNVGVDFVQYQGGGGNVLFGTVLSNRLSGTNRESIVLTLPGGGQGVPPPWTPNGPGTSPSHSPGGQGTTEGGIIPPGQPELEDDIIHNQNPPQPNSRPPLVADNPPAPPRDDLELADVGVGGFVVI